MFPIVLPLICPECGGHLTIEDIEEHPQGILVLMDYRHSEECLSGWPSSAWENVFAWIVPKLEQE